MTTTQHPKLQTKAPKLPKTVPNSHKTQSRLAHATKPQQQRVNANMHILHLRKYEMAKRAENKYEPTHVIIRE